uniref:Uncharacterized protein n=1 Tax=uncultured marine microorganism HF4000_ANIW137J11 TaxID=455532 RepID=B3T4P4_9ZZZZ|nr:hypothetical protein ALOHA_HF4000ANIW137J11ctg1g7 [uncultured marine microorganism HF4000_ANIW137J11]
MDESVRKGLLAAGVLLLLYNGAVFLQRERGERSYHGIIEEMQISNSCIQSTHDLLERYRDCGIIESDNDQIAIQEYAIQEDMNVWAHHEVAKEQRKAVNWMIIGVGLISVWYYSRPEED